MARKRTNNSRESVSLLATGVVLLFGFMGAMFLIATSVDHPLWPALACSGVFILVVVMVASLYRDSAAGGPSPGLVSWFRSKKPDPMPDYSPRRVRTSGETGEGDNAPPTADDVRDAREGSLNTWVPSSVPKEKP